MENSTKTFVVPSGKYYTIREQNGADDDILSNQVEAQQLKNLSNFISGIVVDTDATTSGKLNPKEAHLIPSLDRYCILFNSRIFSLGQIIEFSYDWGKGLIKEYEQDLNEFLLDYSKPLDEKELNDKPNAIPYYPLGDKTTNIEIITTSGKKLLFDLMNASGEAYFLNLPKEEQTRNAGLRARNLRLLVGDKYDLVTNFSLFSVTDMKEIRKLVFAHDPVFQGITELVNPNDGTIEKFPIMGLNNFFYLGED